MGSSLGALKTAARRVGLSAEEYQAQVAAGQKWCTGCKEWHPVGTFARDSSRGDSRSAQCAKRYPRAKPGPTNKDRAKRLAVGEKWCSDCEQWLPKADVAQGRCRSHRNAAARAWYAAGSAAAVRRRGRTLARRRGLEPTPAWWAQETKAEFSGQCAYGCGRPGTTWDHIWPVSRGGVSAPGNLAPACGTCNSRKKNHDPTPWVERGLLAFPWQWSDLMDLAIETNHDDWCSWDRLPWGPLAGQLLVVPQ